MGIADNFHPRPVFVLNITGQCNLFCKHCYNNTGKRRYCEPTTEQLLQTIDKIAGFGKTIVMNGGEPFARNDLSLLIQTASNNGLHVSLRCNGTLITDKILEQIKDYTGEVMVSLEGASSYTHDFIRGNGSFLLAMNAFKLLQKYQIPSIAGITINQMNLHEIDNYVKVLEQFQPDRLAFGQLILQGRGKKLKHLSLSQKAMMIVQEKIERLTAESPIKIAQICTLAGFCSHDPLYTVTLNGKITPCFTREDLAIGNVVGGDFEELIIQVDKIRHNEKLHSSLADYKEILYSHQLLPALAF